MRYGRLQCFGFGFGAHAALRGGGQLRLHRLPGRLATLDCRLGAQLGVCGHHLFFLSSDKYFFLLAMLGAWSPFLMAGGYLAAIVALGSYIAAIGVGLAALPLAMAGAAAVEVGVLVRTWGALGASVLPTSA